MNDSLKNKALCFVEHDIAQKHNAFFSSGSVQYEGNFMEFPFADDFLRDVHVYGSISSTLDICHDLSREKSMRPFSSVICKEQTKGRGQLRREWKSLNGNLYTALVLPDAYPFNTEAAAPAVGVLFAVALENLGFGVELKWPNDLVQKKEAGYEKIGGILLEERSGCLVAGTGINLFSSPSDAEMRENFFMSAGKLQGFEQKETKEKFLNYFYNSLALPRCNFRQTCLQHTEKTDETDNFSAILGFWFALVKEIKLCYEKKIISCNTHAWNAMYKKYLAFLGDTVLVKDALVKKEFSADGFSAGDLAGQIIGLGQEGELLLSSENGLMCIVGGSITKFKG